MFSYAFFLVCLVLTVGAVKPKYASMRVLAVPHLVQPHVPAPALITPGIKGRHDDY